MRGASLEGFLLANRDAEVAMGRAEQADPWAGSPFEWLLRLPSRRRGKAGEVLAEAWLRRLGYKVERPLDSSHDRIVEGRKVEIKFSTLWESGDYVFQQLRDQEYELALLLGVSPAVAHGWIVTKSQALEHSVSQHGGARGSDTKWIRFRANAVPAWLDEHGGHLDRLEGALAGVFGNDEIAAR